MLASHIRLTGQGMQTGSILKVDYRNLISRADVTYDTPVARSEAGLPVGNGSVGSLVWTTPTAVRFQINRVDVFGNNAASNNFFERNTDYSGGTGFVDVDFVDYGKPVFSGSNDNESVWGGHNTVEEMSAMYGLLPVAIRAAEILGIDVELRSAWEEFLDNLAPRVKGTRPLAYNGWGGLLMPCTMHCARARRPAPDANR